MMLLVAVVHSDDAPGLLDALTKRGYRATRINTAGGFLKESNATILLDLDVREGLRRKAASGGGERVDRFESETLEFHERVRRGYRELAAAEPARWVVVDASQPPEATLAIVLDQVRRRLPETEAGSTRR